MSANPHETVVSPTTTAAPASTAGGDAWAETDVAKKYGGDPKKANAGWIALQNHASAQQKENAELKERLARVDEGLARINGKSTGPTSVTHALAQDLAVDPSTLQGAVAETLIALLAPGAAAQAAVASYANETEGFDARQSKVFAWRDKNPEVAARYAKMEQADPRGAVEWLDGKYVQQPEASAEEAPEISAQRTHAGNPGGTQGAVRMARGSDPAQQVSELAEGYGKGEVQKEHYRAAALDQTSGKQEFLRQLTSMTGVPQG